MNVLLEVRDLRTYFFTDEGIVRAVDGVSFSIPQGKTVCLVGESGCGKSVTSLSILRLVSPPGRIVGGQILLRETDLLKLPEEQMRRIRGRVISMIFQEPMTSLNPVYTVGAQIMEAILTHENVARREARARTIEMLRRVGIPSPETRVDEYPHQLSGGMRQRAMIAMALVCRPQLLIADEPTTALDVTVQAQILDLLADLQQEYGMSILFITHNLSVVAQIADEVVVMYASKVAERAPVEALFGEPLHPYTHGLFRSIPMLGTPKEVRLRVIPGNVPNPLQFPAGCKFHPRCAVAVGRCSVEEPALEEHRQGHWAACYLIQQGQPPAGLREEVRT